MVNVTPNDEQCLDNVTKINLHPVFAIFWYTSLKSLAIA